MSSGCGKSAGAVVPQRTATQRRVYSDAHVHRLKLLRQTTLLGHPIGSIASLPDEALETLIKEAAARMPVPSPQPIDDGPRMPAPPIIQECIEVVKALDAGALNTLLERAAVNAGHTTFLRQVLTPLAQRLGDLWSGGLLRN